MSLSFQPLPSPEAPQPVPAGIDAASVLERITDAFFALDREWRFTYVNRAAERLMRRRRDELLGHVPWELFPHTVGSVFQQQYQRAVREGQAAHFEAPSVLNPGTRYEVRAYPGADGLSVFFCDVTARRDADREVGEREGRFRTVVDSLAEGLVISDRSGIITYVNRRMEEISGYHAEEMRGSFAPELFLPRDEQEQLLDPLRRRLAGESDRYEIRLRRRDGSRVSVEVHGVPFRDSRGEIIGTLGIVADISERKAAEEALRESEERFRAFVENTSDIYQVLGPGNRIEYVSPSVERVLGYAPQELIGTDCAGLLHPEDGERFAALFEQKAERPVTFREQFRLRHRAGAWRIFEVSVRTVPDAAGTSVRLVNSRDVTERSRAEQGVRFLAEVGQTLGSSLDPEQTLTALSQLIVPRIADSCIVYLLDEAGQVRRLKAAHADPEKESRLRAQIERHPLDLEGLIRPVAGVLREGCSALLPSLAPQDLVGEGWLSPGNTSRDAVVPHAMVIVPLTARGRTFGAISLGMTEPDRAFGTEDRVLAEALAGRASLALDNARLHEEVRAASAARSRFYALMGHELRAPLGAILLYGEVLLSGADGALNPEQQRGLELSHRSALHLSELVDDLLDLSKIEADKVEIRPGRCDIRVLVEDLLATLRPVAERRGSLLQVEFPEALPEIVTDARRVRQILLNLISNAVKFGEGKPIRIACVAEGMGVAIGVTDLGPGIAPEDQDRVWDEFVQLESSNREERSGTGLGLAVSRRFAELLGGRIDLHSQRGAGSTFRLHLPPHPPQPRTP